MKRKLIKHEFVFELILFESAFLTHSLRHRWLFLLESRNYIQQTQNTVLIWLWYYQTTKVQTTRLGVTLAAVDTPWWVHGLSCSIAYWIVIQYLNVGLQNVNIITCHIGYSENQRIISYCVWLLITFQKNWWSNIGRIVAKVVEE